MCMCVCLGGGGAGILLSFCVWEIVLDVFTQGPSQCNELPCDFLSTIHIHWSMNLFWTLLELSAQTSGQRIYIAQKTCLWQIATETPEQIHLRYKINPFHYNDPMAFPAAPSTYYVVSCARHCNIVGFNKPCSPEQGFSPLVLLWHKQCC